MAALRSRASSASFWAASNSVSACLIASASCELSEFWILSRSRDKACCFSSSSCFSLHEGRVQLAIYVPVLDGTFSSCTNRQRWTCPRKGVCWLSVRSSFLSRFQSMGLLFLLLRLTRHGAQCRLCFLLQLAMAAQLFICFRERMQPLQKGVACVSRSTCTALRCREWAHNRIWPIHYYLTDSFTLSDASVQGIKTTLVKNNQKSLRQWW